MKKRIRKNIFIIASIIFILTILISSITNSNLLETKEYLKRKLDPRIFAILQVFGDIERSSKKLNNDYNVKFLPSTQFINLNLKKIDFKNYFSNENSAGYAQHLKIKVRQVFYIESHGNKIIL